MNIYRENQINEMTEVIERWRRAYRGIDKGWQSVVVASELYEEGYRNPRWISVNERLPDPQKHDWVLVNLKFYEDGTNGVPHIAEYRNGKWWLLDGDHTADELFLTVTHWQPLPDYPIESEDI